MGSVEITDQLSDVERAALIELLDRATEADGEAPLSEHKWLALQHARRGEFLALLDRRPDSKGLSGYGQLAEAGDSYELEYVIDPAEEDDAEAIGRGLVRAAVEEIARRSGGRLRLWARGPSTSPDAVASTLQMTAGRELLQLRRPLPIEDELRPKAPPVTRPFRVGADENAWLAVNARAFAEHPEQGSWSLETLRDRENQPWFDPAGFLLHESEGVLDAFCWTKIHEGEPRLGEIFVIAVDPGHQGAGLGRALLTAGLDYLSAEGIAVAMLYVDGADTAAMGLYRAFRFEVHHRDREYVIDVAPQ